MTSFFAHDTPNVHIRDIQKKLDKKQMDRNKNQELKKIIM